MLFGGRELRERALWVRLLTVAAVLSMAAPLIRFSVGTLQDQFLKMSLEDTQALLTTHPVLGPVVGRDRDVRANVLGDRIDHQSRSRRLCGGPLHYHQVDVSSLARRGVVFRRCLPANPCRLPL